MDYSDRSCLKTLLRYWVNIKTCGKESQHCTKRAKEATTRVKMQLYYFLNKITQIEKMNIAWPENLWGKPQTVFAEKSQQLLSSHLCNNLFYFLWKKKNQKWSLSVSTVCSSRFPVQWRPTPDTDNRAKRCYRSKRVCVQYRWKR